MKIMFNGKDNDMLKYFEVRNNVKKSHRNSF